MNRQQYINILETFKPIQPGTVKRLWNITPMADREDLILALQETGIEVPHYVTVGYRRGGSYYVIGSTGTYNSRSKATLAVQSWMNKQDKQLLPDGAVYSGDIMPDIEWLAE
jgi:hypothetical protein